MIQRTNLVRAIARMTGFRNEVSMFKNLVRKYFDYDIVGEYFDTDGNGHYFKKYVKKRHFKKRR